MEVAGFRLIVGDDEARADKSYVHALSTTCEKHLQPVFLPHL